MDEGEKGERLLAKIASGENITSVDEMTEEYKSNLIHLLIMQFDSEWFGGLGYVPWIEKAPTMEEKWAMTNIARDEISHAMRCSALLKVLGVSTDELLATRDRDRRLDIFRYPIPEWHDLVMFNFLMDRAAGHQLEDYKYSSYAPWARVIEVIDKEEESHVEHGEKWVKRLCENPQIKKLSQQALDTWYPRTMDIFGRPKTAKNALYRKLGLKRRDNEEVRQAFYQEIKPLIEGLGLRLPDYYPTYGSP